jgi:hypothetical protein
MRMLFIVLFFPLSSFGLVEYDDASAQNFQQKSPRKLKAPNTITRNPAPSRSPSLGKGLFSLKMGYRSVDISDKYGEGNLNQYYFNAHFETPFNIYLDVNHWMGTSSSPTFSSDSSTQQGNPEVKVGFNWLKIGQEAEMAKVDLIGGIRVGQSSSSLASGRTDQMYGVETTKRYQSFVIGLGYLMTLTGTSDNDAELEVGDIKTIMASVGWRATADIGFAIEVASTKIDKGEDSTRQYSLDESISLGYISPKLMLGISPLINLEMGALFRTKKPRVDNEILRARLWNQKGLYGNSLYSSLNFSI